MIVAVGIIKKSPRATTKTNPRTHKTMTTAILCQLHSYVCISLRKSELQTVVLRQRQKFYWSFLFCFVLAHGERKKKVFLFSFLSVHPHTCGKWVFNNLRERIMPEQIIFPWLFSNKRLKRRTCVRAFVLNTEKVASKCLMRLDFSLFIAGYFWHITDLHFDSSYSTRGDIVRSRF